MDYELGVIGGGNMAEAILGAAVRSGFLSADNIVVADVAAQRREKLTKELGLTCVETNDAPAACPRVLLAVKPQVMGEMLDAEAKKIRDDALVISIAAGLSTAFFDGKLNGRGRIVRVMPNTPMLVGQGASAVSGGPRATKDDVAWTRKLFTCGGGLEVEVDESLMDAVTCVSGSGPAYFFYFIEAMIQAGVEEGLTPQDALKLATQTCAGAAELLAETGEEPAELRRRVTSPGGTTQRAIETMDAKGVKDHIIAALHACAQRSRELGA
ncbi:MAG: pyrroline-5-carboxylate reductase [Phycisphaerae bacterium]|nr:pyrroline-5-carboxylate reductase [Phycisphaerae bacterium]